MKKIILSLIHGLLKFMFIIFLRVEIRGLEHVPQTGACILAPSHLSNLDPPLVGSFIPRLDIHFFAKEELFKNKFIGAFFLFVNAFPVKRRATDRKSLENFLNLLNAQNCVLIFPEGTRRKVGKKPIAKKGLGFFVAKSMVPVLPIKVENTNNIFFGKIKMTVGEPIYFDKSNNSIKNLEYQLISQKILDRIESL
ncbi:MAG: 1-acyl-sn-glycerol-3-phosphate acyltransferase [bacterium]|nr:1-acyl-sn-glycerol-3-phosphate acyltransferase [bacterium]